MRLPLLAATALAGLAFAMPAGAQETERYSLERTDDGYVRLDTETGRMSLCQERQGELVCHSANEQETDGQGGMARLSERVDELEKRIAELERGRAEADLPSEQEFEQTMTYMERFFRRFMNIIQDFDETFGNEQAPNEQRT